MISLLRSPCRPSLGLPWLSEKSLAMKIYYVIEDTGEGYSLPIAMFTTRNTADKLAVLYCANTEEIELDEFSDVINNGYLPYIQYEKEDGSVITCTTHLFDFTTTPFSKEVDVTPWYDRKSGPYITKLRWYVWAKEGDAERVFANFIKEHQND